MLLALPPHNDLSWQVFTHYIVCAVPEIGHIGNLPLTVGEHSLRISPVRCPNIPPLTCIVLELVVREAKSVAVSTLPQTLHTRGLNPWGGILGHPLQAPGFEYKPVKILDPILDSTGFLIIFLYIL